MWSSKNLPKIISADEKPDVKQQEIKEMVAESYNFYNKYLQNLK